MQRERSAGKVNPFRGALSRAKISLPDNQPSLINSQHCYRSTAVWLGGTVVRALDLQLEIAGSVPAAALSSATIGKPLMHTCLCHQAV